MRKELGKIQKASFGRGGYQECMIGVSFDLGGESWGAGDFWGAWNTDRTASTQWTEESRLLELGAVCMRLSALLIEAKVYTVDQLDGKPIEATFDGNKLESWRILKEVL